MPSLSERKEDIPVLARHFLAQSAKQLGVEAKHLSDDALDFLRLCKWQGNVRQLENLCYWFTVMVPGQVIEIKDMPQDLFQKGTARQDDSLSWDGLLERDVSEKLVGGQNGLMAAFCRRFETVMIQSALRHTKGRKNEAAGLLGIGRNTLTRKIRELDITDTDDN